MNETEPEASGSSRTDQSQSNQTSASGDAVSTDPANAEEMQTNTSSDDPVFEEPLQVSILEKLSKENNCIKRLETNL